MAENQQFELLGHIRAQIDEQKREVDMYYAELKLKLPAYLKNKTIGELREAGAIVDPNIYLTKRAENYLMTSNETKRKKTNLLEKLIGIRDQHKHRINTYYKDIKNQLPQELLNKKIGMLSEEEWLTLGIDIIEFKKKLAQGKRGI